MIAAVKIGGSSEQMHLHHGKFRWPWPCADAILRASSNGAHRGLHSKPLEAAIGRLLAVYCPGSRQGDNQLNDSETCTQFVGRFNGHRDAAVLYRAHCPMEEACGFINPLNATIGQAHAPIL